MNEKKSTNRMVSRLRNLSRDSLALLERVNSRAILYIGGLTDRSEVLLAFYVVTPENSPRIEHMVYISQLSGVSNFQLL